MHKHTLLTLLTFSLLVGSLRAQPDTSTYFQGYTEAVSGTRFTYHSPFSDASLSLLLRGQESFEPISWKTEIVPLSYQASEATFIWLFAMDVTADPVQFQLCVNDIPIIDFSSSTISEKGRRIVAGREGAELCLDVTMLDKYADQMGFAILRLPIDLLHKGQPNLITVSTQTANNNAWLMTYKTRVEESVDIYQHMVVVKDKDRLLHAVSIDFIHIGPETDAEVRIGEISAQTRLKSGFNKLEMNVPMVKEPTTYEAQIRVGDKEPIVRGFTMKPVREWEIYLVQHTHTDIGYTRPQTEILPEHLRYIDDALDFCDLTDHFPDEAKFRWTCETSWSVREYLRCRPKAQTARLLRRIAEGRIEVTAMFLNYSEIVDEQALAAQTAYLAELDNYGIKPVTAMQNDVNGIGWCLVDYFNSCGVKYLNMGLHAHRAQKPFDKPTAFWWLSPSGNRILAYRGEHYQHANELGLTSGQADVIRTKLSRYLTMLEENGYSFNRVALQYSGYITDNAPPSAKACELIRDWNEKYAWPRLRSAVASEFPEYLEKNHAKALDELQVAWPDWWSDGVASAANETALVRKTQYEITAINAILSMVKMSGLEMPLNYRSDSEEIYDKLLFYDEHTYGSAESVTDPLTQNSIDQWSMKSAYAWEASKRTQALAEKTMAFIEPGLVSGNKPVIAVFNTLNWQRSGMVQLFLRFEAVPEGVPFTVTDANGKEVACVRYERRQEGIYYGLWVDSIPAMGYKTLMVNIGKTPAEPLSNEQQLLENQYYRLTVDVSKGLITHIFDKELQRDLVDQADTLSLGQLVYERLNNRHELERLTNTNRDTVYVPLKGSRETMRNLTIRRLQQGLVYSSMFLHGALPACADEKGINIEIRLYHKSKKIELLYSMIKREVTDAEALYVAFPFRLDEGKLAFEVQGGVVRPGDNQLEGSSSDWNAIQHFAVVRNKQAQIIFTSNEVPLVQFGDINTGHYYYRLKPKSNHIFSWVLNNYWVTNFKASQEGELRWTYSLTSAADCSDVAATRFGWGEAMPMLARILMPASGTDEPRLVDQGFLTVKPDNLLLVQAIPARDGDGVVLMIRELSGIATSIKVTELTKIKLKSVLEVNILEKAISKPLTQLDFKPFETKSIKLTL
ncbi:MAG: hypothetical protein KKD74_13665 [Bacteroidetes bacterium]|nr:hypothetical protein [Bacteroidota bacterium]